MIEQIIAVVDTLQGEVHDITVHLLGLVMFQSLKNLLIFEIVPPFLRPVTFLVPEERSLRFLRCSASRTPVNRFRLFVARLSMRRSLDPRLIRLNRASARFRFAIFLALQKHLRRR